MKNLSCFLFPMVFLTLFNLDIAAQVADGGSASISISCDDGKIAGKNANGTLVCVQEVKFFNENGLSLNQAKAKAAENGWTLATAQELTDAFNKLKYSHFAFGTLADGQMAVPVQSDMSSFKKGVNIGVVGGNQGFFYTIKPGTPIVVPPTTPTTPVTSNTITLSGDAGDPIVIDQSEGGYYSKEFFKINGIPYEGSQVQKYNQLEAKYKNGIGNIMQDKWDDVNYRPILERALNAYVAEKFPNQYPANNIHLVDYLKSQIQDKDEHCADCMITRYEFVGFFVPEYLKMLRTGSNPGLQQQFAEYVSYGLAKANRETLESWKYYSRRTSAQLANEPYIPGFHLNDKARLDPDVLGTNETYQYNDFASVFIHSAVPLPGKSVDEFKYLGMNGAPFFFTLKERSRLSDFIIPVSAQAYSGEEGVSDVAANIPNYLGKNLSIETVALNIVKSEFTKIGTGLATGGAVITGGFTLFLIHAATENSAKATAALVSVANNALLAAESELSSAITVAQKAAGKAAVKVATQRAANAGAKIAITNTAKLGNKALGPLLGNAIGPIAIGVGIFMSGFMPTGGKAIEIAAFEDNLKNDCYIKERQKDWMAMSDGEKVENFSFLFKMLIIDPDDFTYLVPLAVADKEEQRRIESEAAVMVSQQTAKYGALGNAVYGSLDARYNTMAASPPTGFIRIQNNWYKNNYIHNQNGTIEQGAIEPNWWSSQWKIVPAHDGLVRIQNKWKPDQYIHNQNRKLEVGPIQTNWQSALWKITPESNGWVRIQNAWFTNHYIHNQNGTLEVGPIQRNWASTLWKMEFNEVLSGGTATTTTPTTTTTTGSNVALNKATKQSSDFGTHNSTFAVDGNTKDRHSGAMYTTTQDDTNPWWEVDLGANYDINQINIFNVTDHFKSRLQNLNIKVSKTPFTRNEDGQAFASNVFPDPVGNYKGNATGRYVRVYITRKDYLNICEVQVMGTPATTTTTTTTTTTMAPAAPGYVRIQSVEKEGHYIHNQNGTLEVGPIQADWSSAQWKIITHAGDWVNIQSRSNPELYLNINGDKLEVAKVPPSYASCVWLKISMPSGSKNVRFLSNLHQSKYLLDQNGKIEVGEINTSSQSAIWKIN